MHSFEQIKCYIKPCFPNIWRQFLLQVLSHFFPLKTCVGIFIWIEIHSKLSYVNQSIRSIEADYKYVQHVRTKQRTRAKIGASAAPKNAEQRARQSRTPWGESHKHTRERKLGTQNTQEASQQVNTRTQQQFGVDTRILWRRTPVATNTSSFSVFDSQELCCGTSE